MYKKGPALAFVFTVAFAILHLVPQSSTGSSDLANQSKLDGRVPQTAKPARAKSPSSQSQPAPTFLGGCAAYDHESKSNVRPFDDNVGAAKKVLDAFFSPATRRSDSNPLSGSVRYLIALAPDPRHTNLSFMFDREISILIQSAQDQGYDYDSSWLPWKKQDIPAFSYLADQQYAAELTEEREACPGVLLFRKRPDPTKQDDEAAYPYEHSLLVFVVGEQATGGINENQWSNAIQWLTLNASIHDPQTQGSVSDDGVLRVLGPTFTGSLVSMERDLTNIYKEYKTEKDKSELQKKFPAVRVLSGSVSGCSAVHWFETHLPSVNNEKHIDFGTFQENDGVHIARFLNYIERQGTRRSEIAIVSEDETAYGTSNVRTPNADEKDPCDLTDNAKDPVQLLYPRDISALREAYQKQSVFESPDLSLKNNQHPILRELAGEPETANEVSDTVPSLSGGVSAIDQEAYLYGLVSFLRTHHTRVLILRCTNPLDFLFLTRFFHRAYPEARIVTVGSDLLIRREIDTTEFRGVLSLSSYPLLPRDQHWSTITEDDWGSPSHYHLIFQGHLLEGMYIAARYLLQEQKSKDGEALIVDHSAKTNYPIEMKRVIPTPDYTDPFWFSPDPSVDSFASHPPTWLAAVGRDGYWPVAVLRGGLEENSTMVELIQPNHAAPQHYDHKRTGGERNGDRTQISYSPSLLMGLPLPWLVCTLLALALVCYQLRGVTRGGGDPSDGLLSAFHTARNPWQSWLLGLNCALAMTLFFELTAIFLIPSTFATISSDWHIESAFALGLLLFAGLICALVTRFGDEGFEYGVLAAVSCLAVFLVFLLLYIYSFFADLGDPTDVPLFYRSAHLTDGVSPLVPVLLLTFGFYLWNWQVMAGHLMLADGAPTLPELRELSPALSERRIGREFGERILAIANPVNFPFKISFVPLFLIFTSGLCFIPHNLPLLSLEGDAFDQVVNGLLLLALVLTVAEAIRLYSTWVRLKELLLALGRLRLRRTIASLRSLEGKSVWSVSGNGRRVQYDLFIKQLDAAIRLIHLTPALPCVEDVVVYGREFRERSDSQQRVQWDLSLEPPARAARKIRDVLSSAVAEIYEGLQDFWHNETDSLDLKRTNVEAEDRESVANRLPLSEFSDIQVAEEFISYHYVAFIQNVTARMRTMTLSMIFLFIAACFAVSFYPFVPRTEIAVWLILNLALIGSAVAYVYAGMERDEILSYITNTIPGRLGTEFWLKLAGFLVGPVIGILATQFPSLADTALRWLQPGLDAMR